MTFEVYGLRLRGTHEVRYIGQTMQGIDARLLGHIRAAQNMPCKSTFAQWLLSNLDDVEVFAVNALDNRDEAVAFERMMIEACARLGFRLFNIHNVPSHLRAPRTRAPWPANNVAAITTTPRSEKAA